MKIAFFTDSIFNLGGVQRVTSVVASELSKEHEVDVICTATGIKENRDLYGLHNNVKSIFDSGFKEVNVVTKAITGSIKLVNKKTGLLNNKLLLPVAKLSYTQKELQKKFRNFINEKGYDVVIGVEGKYSLILASIKNDLQCKVIGWQHNSYEAYFETPNKYYYNQSEIYGELLKKLDYYIVLTEHDKSMLKNKMDLSATRIYNPLSFESEVKSNLESKNLISVGRLAKQQKGFDLLLKAFEKVVRKHTDWKLSIVGDGEDKEELVEMSKVLGIEANVDFKGSTNDISKEYINASIYVSSSRWEGFGLVITEAMECGLPVVAFNNSGPSEIITNNKDGILVERENIEKLSEAMNKLIESKELRNSMASNAIVRANDFNVENIVAQWNKVINRKK